MFAETIAGFFHVAGDEWPVGAAFASIMLIATLALTGLFLKVMGRDGKGLLQLTQGTRALMSVIYWAFVVYLFVPLALMVVMGFKDSKFIGFPIKGWTLEWYQGVFQSAEVIDVFLYSMTIAIASTMLSLIIGTWTALLLGPNRFFGRAVLFAAHLPARGHPRHHLGHLPSYLCTPSRNRARHAGDHPRHTPCTTCRLLPSW